MMISQKQIKNRYDWVNKIGELRGDFGGSVSVIEKNIRDEINKWGVDVLLGHLRLCGAIPELYDHDSSKEKLYSKYTDIIINEAYRLMGFNSKVLEERGDVADVEAENNNYRFVADAKVFRLSRTAKNQKDFKISSMDRWKYGRQYAMIVCPFYQLPKYTSQIYEQAGARSVCIATYTHLAVLVRYQQLSGYDKTMELLHEIFKTVDAMNPSKDATCYWQQINLKMLEFDTRIRGLWIEEKRAFVESMLVSKEEALRYVLIERKRIEKLTKHQAMEEILRISKIDEKKKVISEIKDNGLLEVGNEP